MSFTWVQDGCYCLGQELEGNERWHYVTADINGRRVSGWVHENWLRYTAGLGSGGVVIRSGWGAER